MNFNKYEKRKLKTMDNIIDFSKKLSSDEKITINDLAAKIYNNRQINNIYHELMMTVDKILQQNKYEFKTAADKDFVMIESHKFLINILIKFIKEK